MELGLKSFQGLAKGSEYRFWVQGSSLVVPYHYFDKFY